VRLKLTLPIHRGEGRQLLAFVFGAHRPEPVGEPPANYRPFAPRQNPHTCPQPRHRAGDMRQRPYTTLPTSQGLVSRPRLATGKIVPRTAQPISIPGLTPVAHNAPPDARLARLGELEEDPAETTMAMPQIGDLDLLVYGAFEDRLVLVDVSSEQLLRAAHDTTLRTTQAGLQWLEEASREFDRKADELFPPTPPRIPQFEDIAVPFATGRRRAPSEERRPSVAGLFPALPAAPARHALPGGAK
jgi:hypothetical protein